MTVPQEPSTTTPADTNIDMAVLHTHNASRSHTYSPIYTQNILKSRIRSKVFSPTEIDLSVIFFMSV